MRYTLQWVTNKFEQGEKIDYLFFWGHSNKGEDVGKFIFSQWFPSEFSVDGIRYKTAEHWMMAQKALLFNAIDICDKIVKADKPGEVKALGRKIEGFDQQLWDARKFEIVRQGNIHKFDQNQKFKEYLLGTDKKVIVEASPTDNIWGIGLSQDTSNIEDPRTWRGENLLGFAIMEARDFLTGNQK